MSLKDDLRRVSNRLRRILAMNLKERQPVEPKQCEWEINSAGQFFPGCDGYPVSFWDKLWEKGFEFCPYCAKPTGFLFRD